MNRKSKLRVLVFCCAFIWALALIKNLAFFAYDRTQTPQTLSLENAELFDIERSEEGGWQSLSSDPRFVFEGINTGLRRVVLQGDLGAGPGEMDLYYTRKPGQGFSARKRVWARPLEGGGYEYRLPPGRVDSLRIDMGTSEQNLLQNGAVLLNERLPLRSYFFPTPRALLALLLLPVLASCVIYTIIEAGIILFPQKGKTQHAE